MFLADSQVAMQQYVLRMVPRGYWWWISGICAKKEALAARAEKYAEFYGTDLPKHTRYYRKSKGLANALLVACQLPDEKFFWILLATDGRGPIRENGKLKDARTNPGRILWYKDYVFYQSTRPSEHGGGQHWSWFITPQIQKELDHYVGQILKEASRSPGDLAFFFQQQVRRPMHSGIRSFITRLIRRAHKNFRAMYPDMTWPGPDPDKPLPILNTFKKSGGLS